MADYRLEAKNNQKKEFSSFASGIVPTSTAVDDFFTLPEASVVTRASVIVLKADSTSGATVDVVVAGVTVADEVKVDAVGVSDGTQANTYFATGGAATVKPGSTAPAGDGLMKVFFEYVETELTEGTYTN